MDNYSLTTLQREAENTPCYVPCTPDLEPLSIKCQSFEGLHTRNFVGHARVSFLGQFDSA